MAVTRCWIELGESPEKPQVVEETGPGLNELRFGGLANNKFQIKTSLSRFISRANVRTRNKFITTNPADANSGYGCNGRNYKIIYIYHYNY